LIATDGIKTRCKKMKALIETIKLMVIFAILTIGIVQIAVAFMTTSPNTSGIEL